jgi:hypothetical protein
MVVRMYGGWFYDLDCPVAALLVAIAERIGVRWPPPRCRLCGGPGSDPEVYDRIMAAATHEEKYEMEK